MVLSRDRYRVLRATLPIRRVIGVVISHVCSTVTTVSGLLLVFLIGLLLARKESLSKKVAEYFFYFLSVIGVVISYVCSTVTTLSGLLLVFLIGLLLARKESLSEKVAEYFFYFLSVSVLLILIQRLLSAKGRENMDKDCHQGNKVED